MPISKPLQNFLDKNKIKYEVIEHKIVYTAHDKAATLHVKPDIVGKTMLVVFDGKNYAIGLISANKNLDKKKVLAAFNNLRKKAPARIASLARQANASHAGWQSVAGGGERRHKKIDFAKEAWMKKTFKGIDVGATPPFGSLYNLPFFIDNSLTKQTKIIVNGGKYNLSFKISLSNLLKLNPPAIKGTFSMAKK